MKEDERILNAITPIVNARKTHKDDNLYSLQLNSYQLDMLQALLDLYNKEKLNSFNLSEQLNKEKEKNKKIEDKIKGKINNLEIFKKTLPIRATEIERFIGELKDLLEE